jgi:hypothetical protein
MLPEEVQKDSIETEARTELQIPGTLDAGKGMNSNARGRKLWL